ncbi:olfactory receptor 6F1-like [Lissotriton helveticus]
MQIKVTVAKSAITQISVKKAAGKYLAWKTQVYESSEKIGHLLETRTRERIVHARIREIRDPDLGLETETKAIMTAFQKFYQKLYTEDIRGGSQKIQDYLTGVALGQLSAEEGEQLEGPITWEELSTAIDQTPIGKATGPDSMPGEFYKKFKTHIMGLMLEVFQRAQRDQITPDSWKGESIIVFLKKGSLQMSKKSRKRELLKQGGCGCTSKATKKTVKKSIEHGNRTTTNIFIFVGFEVVQGLQIFLFALFATMYILTISSNMMIITLVTFERKLHKPMYHFLSSFSFLEILYTTATVPKMLVTLLTDEKTISVPICIAQFYFLFAFGACENFLLAVMAYDRYVAICNPLRYAQIMSDTASCYLAIGAWMSAMFAPVLPALWISSLTFCTPNEIDHFFCDFAPLLKLSCGDTSVGQFTFLAIAWIVILGCCLLTMISYTCIIRSILCIPSTAGQKKAFNTCASHLTVLIIFYGTVIFMYIRPNSSIRFSLDKVVSIFYCVVTPLLNPLIYSLRNKEMRDALRKIMNMCLSMFGGETAVQTNPHSSKEIGTRNKSFNLFRIPCCKKM